jgi:hypothetical protein
MKSISLAIVLCLIISNAHAGEFGTDLTFPDNILLGREPEPPAAPDPNVSAFDFGEIGGSTIPVRPLQIMPIRPHLAPGINIQQIQQAVEIKDKMYEFKKSNEKVHFLFSLIAAVVLPHQVALMSAGLALYNAFTSTNFSAEKDWWIQTFQAFAGTGSVGQVYAELLRASVSADRILKEYESNPNIVDGQRQVAELSEYLSPEMLKVVNSFGSIRIFDDCRQDVFYAVSFMRPGGVWLMQPWQKISDGKTVTLVYGSEQLLTNNNRFYIYADSARLGSSGNIVSGSPSNSDSREFTIGNKKIWFAPRTAFTIDADHNYTVKICDF